jgi:hypothetical protein
MELLAAQQAALLRLQSGSLFGNFQNQFSQKFMPTSSPEISSAPEKTPLTPPTATTSPVSKPTVVSTNQTAPSSQISLPNMTPTLTQTMTQNLISSQPTGFQPTNHGLGLHNIKELLLLQQQQLQQAQFQQQIAQHQAQQLTQSVLTPESSPRQGYQLNHLMLRGAYPNNGKYFRNYLKLKF